MKAGAVALLPAIAVVVVAGRVLEAVGEWLDDAQAELEAACRAEAASYAPRSAP